MTGAHRYDAEFRPIGDLIRENASAAPGHPALIDLDRELSFAELDRMMDRVAAALHAHGVGPRDTIAICAAASVEYVAVFLGALRIGVAVAPLQPSASAESHAVMAADSGARILFLDATTRASFTATGLPCVALDDSTGESTGGEPLSEPLSTWLATADARPPDVTIEPGWAFNVIYSSGTTGVPKGIEQPHMMRWQHIKRLGPDAFGPASRSVIATPLYSNTTLVCLLPTVASGGTAILMRKFGAREFLALAEKHRATHAMLVPVQYSRIMAAPDFDRFDLSSFRLKLSTSAPFSAALKRDVLQRWPGGLVEYYGMTEGGGSCILHAHEFPGKLHTVGRPSEGSDIRLIDEEGREIVTPGEAGEIVGHSPATMTGYLNQPAKTREAEWFDAQGRRYIRTGDIGRFDADGFLILLDRRKDMIISGGFNIYPSDLEAVLAQHDAVLEASVIGVPSEAWGETPVAFAVAKPGTAIDAEGLRQWANARLGKTQRLAALRVVESLPRSPIGKVLKRELREGFDGRVD
jgi:acyl-CoA synthetase (AMP-forming)/AMP-acid ligase II